MKLLVASMVKDEETIITSSVAAWSSFADEVLLLDDGSEDRTVEKAKEEGAVVVSAESGGTWGEEAPLRKELWDRACERTVPGDWIFILDADMVPSKDPRLLCIKDAVAFPLFDLWTEYSDGMLMYREDAMWQGHLNPRVWLVKRVEEPEEGWQWNPRGVHCGHLPLNYDVASFTIAPSDYGLLHYAYVDSERRNKKFLQYKRLWSQLSPREQFHARSILEPCPPLKTLKHSPEYTLAYTSV